MYLTKEDWFAIYRECEVKDAYSNKSKLILMEIEDLTDEHYQEVFKFLDKTFPDDMADFNETHLPKCQFVEEFVNHDMPYGLADIFRKLGYAIGIPTEHYINKKEVDDNMA